MATYLFKYSPGGTAQAGATQIKTLQYSLGNTDVTTGGWYSGVDDAGVYVITCDTTTTGLAGRTTGGGTGVAIANVPTFWRTAGTSEAQLLAVVNRLPGSPGNLTTTAGATGWLNSNNYGLFTTSSNTAEFYYDPGNILSYIGSGTTLTNIGTAGNVTGTAGTLSGVAYESGTAGGAFNFDGVSDVITFGQYNFGNTITVNAWVYPRTEASINCLMSNAVANTNTNGFKMAWNNWQTTNYTMNFEAGNGSIGNTSSTANNVVVVNAWQMITFVFDKSTPSIKFYKNGVEIATASGGAPVSNIGMNNSNWWMGAIGGSSYQMNANVGLFKIWKSLRSTSDILSEYNSTKSRYGL
jgi:hypothetical protein